MLISSFATYYFLPKNNKSNLENDLTEDLVDSSQRESESGSEKLKKEIAVEAAGAVNKPGLYYFSSEARVFDLVKLAGGFSSKASEVWLSRKLNLAAKLKDAQKIYIPFQWEEEAQPDNLEDELAFLLNEESQKDSTESVITQNEETSSSARSDESENATTTGEKINLNTASSDDLQTLNGVGPAYAEKIITNRPYSDISQFEENSELPSATIEKIKDLISF